MPLLTPLRTPGRARRLRLRGKGLSVSHTKYIQSMIIIMVLDNVVPLRDDRGCVEDLWGDARADAVVVAVVSRDGALVGHALDRRNKTRIPT